MPSIEDYTMNNDLLATPVVDKTNMLLSKKQEKVNNLAGKQNSRILSNYSDTDYTGTHTKGDNTYNTTGVHDFENQQEEFGRLIHDKQVYTRPDGSKYMLEFDHAGTEFDDPNNPTDNTEQISREVDVKAGQYGTPDTRNLYLRNLENEGVQKLGLVRSDLSDEAIARGITPEQARYMDKTNLDFPLYKGKGGLYDGTPGPEAKSAGEALLDVELDYDAATQFELDRYMDRATIASRVAGQGPIDPDTKAAYGKGVSEYTKESLDPLFNDAIGTYEGDLAAGTPTPTVPRGYNAKGEKLSTAYDAAGVDERAQALLDGMKGDRSIAERAVRAAGSGALDLGFRINQFVGTVTEQLGEAVDVDTIREAGENYRKIFEWNQENGTADETVDFDRKHQSEYEGAVGKKLASGEYLEAFTEAVSDPRVVVSFTQSFPEMLALATSLGGMAAVNASNNLDTLNKNTKGNATTEEKVTSVIASVIGTSLDRFGDKAVLSAASPIKDVIQNTLKKFPKAQAQSIIKDAAKAAGISAARFGGAVATETGTEAGQTALELVATKADTQARLKSGEGYTGEEGVEIGTAGILGGAAGGLPAGGRLGLEAAGIVKDGSDKVSEKIKGIKKEKVDKTKTAEDTRSAADLGARGKAYNEYQSMSDNDLRDSAVGVLTKIASDKKSGSSLDVADVTSLKQIHTAMKADNETSKAVKNKIEKKIFDLNKELQDQIRADRKAGKKTTVNTEGMTEEYKQATVNTVTDAMATTMVIDDIDLSGMDEAVSNVETNIEEIEKETGTKVPEATKQKVKSFKAVGSVVQDLSKNLPEVERDILFSNVKGVLPKMASMHALIEERASATPERKAEIKTELKEIKDGIAKFQSGQVEKSTAIKRAVREGQHKVRDLVYKYMNEGVPTYDANNVRTVQKLSLKEAREKVLSDLSDDYKEKVKAWAKGGKKGRINAKGTHVSGMKYKALWKDIIEHEIDSSYDKGVFALQNSVSHTNKITDTLLRTGKLDKVAEKDVTTAKKKAVDAVLAGKGSKEYFGLIDEELVTLKEELAKAEDKVKPTESTLDKLRNISDNISSAVAKEQAKLEVLYNSKVGDSKDNLLDEIARLEKEIKITQVRLAKVKKKSDKYKKDLLDDKAFENSSTSGIVSDIVKMLDSLVGEIKAIAARVLGLEKLESRLSSRLKRLKTEKRVATAGLDDKKRAKASAQADAINDKTLAKKYQTKLNKVTKSTKFDNADIRTTIKYNKALKREMNKLKDDTYKNDKKAIAAIKKRIKKLEDAVTGTAVSKTEIGKSFASTHKSPLVQDIKKLDFRSRGASKLSSTPVENLVEAHKYRDIAIGFIGDTLVNPKDNKFVAGDSPAASILFDREGNLNENLATAVVVAAEEQFVTGAERLRYPDARFVAGVFGVMEEEVTQDMISFVKENGTLRKHYVTSIGSSALSTMGISRGGMDVELYDRLVQDLGQIGALYQVSNGWLAPFSESKVNKRDYVELKDEEFKGKEAELNMVKLGKNMLDHETIVERREKLKSDMDALSIESTQKGPKYVPFTSERDNYKFTPRGSLFGETPKATREALRKLEDTSYTVNDKAVKSLVKLGEKKALKLMGWQDPAVVDADESMLFEDKESAKAHNLELENSYRNLVETHEKAGKGAKMWFEWFFTKNGRLNMDSVVINPQTDKLLHRFLVSMEDHTGMISMDPESETNISFKYALAQAFGVSIDKMSHENVIATADKLIAKGSDKLSKVFDDGEYYLGRGLHIEVEHLGHTLQMMEALKDYEAAVKSGKKSFKTTMSVEYDGITNGFINKQFQFPVDNGVDDYIAKGGVLTEDSKTVGKNRNYKLYDKVDDIGKALEDKKIVDIYKDTALGIDYTEKLYEQNKSDLLPDFVAKKNAELYKGLYSYTKPFVEDSEVTSYGRNLFKYPIMMFNYAASVKNIRKALAHEMVTGALTNVLTDLHGSDVAKAKAAASTIATIRESTKFKSDNELVEALQTQPLSRIKSASGHPRYNTLEKVLVDVFNVGVGTEFEKSMNSKFGNMTNVSEDIVNSFKMMFRAFDHKFKAELSDIKKEYDKTKKFDSVTKERLDKLMDKYKEALPMISGPLSENKYEGVMVSDTASVAQEKTRFPDAQTVEKEYIKKGSKATPASEIWDLTGWIEDDVHKNNISNMMRVMTEAQKAGAVLPIHWLDGANMAEVLNGMDINILGIHDAVLMGPKQNTKALSMYSQKMVEMNANYSVSEEVFKSLLEAEKVIGEDKKSLDTVGFGDEEQDFDSVKVGMRYTARKVAVERAKFYAKNMKVAHMVGPKGSMHEYKGTTDALFDAIRFTSDYTVNETALSRIEETLNKATSKEKDAIITDIIKFLECM